MGDSIGSRAAPAAGADAFSLGADHNKGTMTLLLFSHQRPKYAATSPKEYFGDEDEYPARSTSY